MDELALDDIELRFVDHTRDRPIDVQLAIERLRVAPLRSQMALFDLLYRTNARGSVDGHAFEATSVEDASGRTTVWRAPRLPLALVVPYLGAGSRWIEGGDVEVEVTDRWLTAQRPPEISMHYKVVLRDLDVSFPDDLSPKEKALALPLALAIEKLGREIPLEFELELSEERFRGAASLEAVGLWQAASGALARAMVEETGIEPDALRRWGKLGVGLLEKAIEEE